MMSVREFFRKTFAQIRRELFRSELSLLLVDALEKSVPGFVWVEDVDEANGIVVYSVTLNTYDYGYEYFLRTFTVSDQKVLTLNDDADPVDVLPRYVSKTGRGEVTISNSPTDATTQLSTVAGITVPATSCSCNKATKQNQQMETVNNQLETVIETKPMEEESMDKPKNREEWLALAPEDVDVSLINESLTAIQAERAELEQSLEGVVAPAEVKTLSTQSLRALHDKIVAQNAANPVNPQIAPNTPVVADYSAARSLQTGAPNESRPNAWGLRN